jgi:hypothetical protein
MNKELSIADGTKPNERRYVANRLFQARGACFIHTETYEGDTHNQDGQDQQNQEAAHNRLSPQDNHEEMHSSHPTNE